MAFELPLKKMIETQTGKEYSDDEFQNVLEEHFVKCSKQYCEDYGFLSMKNFLVQIDPEKNGKKLVAIGKDKKGEPLKEDFTFYEFMNITGDIPPLFWRPLKSRVNSFQKQLTDFFKTDGLTGVCYIGESGGKPCLLANTYKDGKPFAEGVRLTEILMNEI